MATQSSKLHTTDINAIIAKVNAEMTRRGLSGVVEDISSNTETDESKVLEINQKMQNINSMHCYCQGNTNIASRHPGSSKIFNHQLVDFEENIDIISATNINKIDADINALIAQCACDTFYSDYCTCRAYTCPCQGDCTCDNRCSCNARCACDTRCPCDARCACDVYCSCDARCACNARCACDGACSCVQACTCQNVETCPCQRDDDGSCTTDVCQEGCPIDCGTDWCTGAA